MGMLEIMPTGEGTIVKIMKNYTIVAIDGKKIYIPTKIIKNAIEAEKRENAVKNNDQDYR